MIFPLTSPSFMQSSAQSAPLVSPTNSTTVDSQQQTIPHILVSLHRQAEQTGQFVALVRCANGATALGISQPNRPQLTAEQAAVAQLKNQGQLGALNPITTVYLAKPTLETPCCPNEVDMSQWQQPYYQPNTTYCSLVKSPLGQVSLWSRQRQQLATPLLEALTATTAPPYPNPVPSPMVVTPMAQQVMVAKQLPAQALAQLLGQTQQEAQMTQSLPLSKSPLSIGALSRRRSSMGRLVDHTYTTSKVDWTAGAGADRSASPLLIAAQESLKPLLITGLPTDTPPKVEAIALSGTADYHTLTQSLGTFQRNPAFQQWADANLLLVVQTPDRAVRVMTLADVLPPAF